MTSETRRLGTDLSKTFPKVFDTAVDDNQQNNLQETELLFTDESYLGCILNA